MATRGRRRYGSRGPKRRLIWAENYNSVTISDDNQAGVGNLLSQFENALGAEMLGYTVTRILGEYSWWSSGGSQVDAVRFFHGGIRVGDDVTMDQVDEDVEDQAVARAPYSDWMYRRVTPWVQTAGVEQQTQAFYNRQVIDIRSKRRIDELGQGLYFSWNQANVNGGLSWSFRVLLMRP